MGYSTYPRSNVLILGQSSICSLHPSTSSVQVESLLQDGKLAEAEALLGQTEGDVTQGGTGLGNQEVLRYLHQCLAFALMRQTRFREATAHFVKGAIDPRIPLSYFDELRPALFNEPPSHEKNDDTDEGDSVEVEVWDGIREYMPVESNVDDIIAINLVRNYSPYLRPNALPGPPAEDGPENAESSTPDAPTKSGTRTHPATIAMREGLREEAGDMVKSILVIVLGTAGLWSRDVIEITLTALALLYAHERDAKSLLALLSPPPTPPPPSSRPTSRPSSRPPSRPASTHLHPSNDHQMSIPSAPSHARHASHPAQIQSPTPSKSALPFRPHVLEPVLSKLNFWGVLIEMWKVRGEWGKVVDILVGLVEETYVDASVVDPLEQIFVILAPARPNDSALTLGATPGLSEPERSGLVKKWAAWLAGKDIERGLMLLTSMPSTRHRRPTGATGRGRDKTADRDTQKADELAILSELQNTNTLAAKRYLEWLVIGRGLGRGGKETTEEEALFEELVWNCLEEVLGYVRDDESIGKLWRAKAASYASSPSTSSTTLSSPPLPQSDSRPSPVYASSSSPLRSPFVSYFTSTTPDSPSKRARIKTLLLFQSLKEGKQLIKDMQDKIVNGGWDKILGLEMAVLHSKMPSTRITLKALYSLGDVATAECYASSDGSTGVVSTKLGISAAEGCGLSDWSAWFARGSDVTAAKRKETDVVGGDMLKMLLEIYMEDGDKPQTTRFLGSQAKRLDALEILPSVPTAWPLNTLSTYLTRTFRRAQHRAHEGQIIKAICAGQNLAVMDSTFEVLREEGAIVEEAVTDDEDEEEGGVGKSFDEKVVLQDGEQRAEVVDVHVGVS